MESSFYTKRDNGFSAADDEGDRTRCFIHAIDGLRSSPYPSCPASNENAIFSLLPTSPKTKVWLFRPDAREMLIDRNAMRDTKNSAADGVRDSKNKMMNSAQSVKSNISNAASSAYTSAAESASDLSDRASNAAQGIQKEAKYAVDQSAARGGGVATTSGTQSGGPVGGRFGGMGNSTHTSTNSTIGSMDGYQEDMVRVSTPVDLNLGKVVQ